MSRPLYCNLRGLSPSKTRDNINNNTQQQQLQQQQIRKFWDFTQQPDVILQVENEDIYAVSYTHLTLPTIPLV